MSSCLSYSLDDGRGLSNLHLTSKGVQEERSTDDDDAHPKSGKRLSITDLPDDFLSLVYKSLVYKSLESTDDDDADPKSGAQHSSFGLVCRHWLHIQNNNHEWLWTSCLCSLRESPKISPESFSKILCKLLIRFQHLKYLFLSGLPEVTNYVTSQSHLFGSEVKYLCLTGFYEYSGKKLSLIFSLFPRLERVWLSDSLITNKGLEVVGKCCPSLQKVDLENCQKITHKGLEILAKCCASLKKVNISHCMKINDKGLEVLVKNCASLTKIDLTNCDQITDEGIEILAKSCASLKKVCLGFCPKITDKGLEVLAKNCASLTKIGLTNCEQITDDGLEILAKSCALLERVDLPFCEGITDSGISFLIQKSSRIHTLHISWCSNVTGIGFLGCPKTLTHVSATNMHKLTKEGIKAITSGGGIESLSLSGNVVNNEVIATTISKGCPLLRSLRLESCPEVQLEGWKAIGLYCTNLERLHVAKCSNLCDEGLKALCYGCNKLSYISVDCWSDHTLELFERERPYVHRKK